VSTTQNPNNLDTLTAGDKFHTAWGTQRLTVTLDWVDTRLSNGRLQVEWHDSKGRSGVNFWNQDDVDALNGNAVHP
jgi:hypothetical protein